MGRIIYVAGGTRSGKSAFAETLAGAYARVIYVAAARIYPGDADMRRRIALHQERRPANWTTIERDGDLTPLLASVDDQDACLLIESVGTLVTNAMLDESDDWDSMRSDERVAFERRVESDAQAWIAALRDRPSAPDAIFVSEEVGLGVVSAYAMGRAFADALGKTNQALAQASDEAYFLVSGLPLRLR